MRLKRVAILSVLAGCCLGGSAATADDLWDHPFKAEDLRDDERVYWARAIHSNSGPQKYGYDLELLRYVTSDTKPEWTRRPAGGDSPKNADYVIYGKPVYAMEDGTVWACWRNAPENPKPGTDPVSHHEEITKYAGNKSKI